MYNHLGPKAETFRAMEALPIELYWEICFAARVWDAVDVLKHYRNSLRLNGEEYAIQAMRHMIWNGDEQAAERYADFYWHKYGIAWPHHAAQATILTFQESAGTKKLRLHASATPRIKAAWAASERLLPR
jgi:hypothetical protein